MRSRATTSSPSASSRRRATPRRKFRSLGGNQYAADGTLSLRGVSKPVTLTFTWTPGRAAGAERQGHHQAPGLRRRWRRLGRYGADPERSGGEHEGGVRGGEVVGERRAQPRHGPAPLTVVPANAGTQARSLSASIHRHPGESRDPGPVTSQPLSPSSRRTPGSRPEPFRLLTVIPAKAGIQLLLLFRPRTRSNVHGSPPSRG